METIRERGLRAGDGGWILPFPTLRDEEDEAVAALRRSGELEYREDELSVCACADAASAGHYAFNHNRSGDRDTPILIEFEVDGGDVAVDGRDMLYTLFQRGDPDHAPAAVKSVYGPAAGRHLEAAWRTDDQLERVAICDRAVLDPAVVAHHHRNRTVVAGRHGTVFSSAFQVRLPVAPSAIRNVHAPDAPPASPPPEIWFERLVRRSG
ncbi:MAG: hypothetical protein V4472_17560 [Pseudomonadota bacterium]